MPKSDTEWKKLSQEVRLSVLEMVSNSGSSHIGAAFSIVDILVVLYFRILNINPQQPKMVERDYFLLSKGHGGAALYATLAHRGFCSVDDLKHYATNNSAMAGHVVKDSIPGIETTAGSLGHGLSMGVGIAIALKADKLPGRTFVLVGDGECNEGAIWEATLVASQQQLDNLVLVIDRNGQQSLGSSDDILNLEPFASKWRDFGWNCLECNGHNFTELIEILSREKHVMNMPTVIIAKTVKGKGVSFMEKEPLTWHYKTPTGELLEQARKELNA